jgi:hypothetical protein
LTIQSARVEFGGVVLIDAGGFPDVRRGFLGR